MRIRLGLAQLLQVHAVHHGWTAEEERLENEQFQNVPGVAADVDHEMPILLVGIYRVKIEEWGGLVLDWMPLSCLPGEVWAQHWFQLQQI